MLVISHERQESETDIAEQISIKLQCVMLSAILANSLLIINYQIVNSVGTFVNLLKEDIQILLFIEISAEVSFSNRNCHDEFVCSTFDFAMQFFRDLCSANKWNVNCATSHTVTYINIIKNNIHKFKECQIQNVAIPTDYDRRFLLALNLDLLF